MCIRDSPIIVHPDVRRMLMTQRALIEGSRALALWTAQALDVSEHHADPHIRQQADDFVALMTPVVKAFLTDMGSECANLGLQVFGGHGYIRDNGQEQLVRDARITQIYEGTNGVQAMDLLGRKVLHSRLFERFSEPVSAYLAAGSGNAALAEFIAPVAGAFARLDNVTRMLMTRAATNPEETGAAAVDYLRLFSLTALGFLWARMADVSLPQGNAEFHKAKLTTARFFMQKLLPQTAALEAAILAGPSSVMELEAAGF